MRFLQILVSLILGMSLTSCAGTMRAVQALNEGWQQIPVAVTGSVDGGGQVKVDLETRPAAIAALISPPVVESQDMHGGWGLVRGSWIDAWGMMGNAGVRVNPNGHFVAMEASYDGVLQGIGGEYDVYLRNFRDNGIHILLITISTQNPGEKTVTWQKEFRVFNHRGS